MPPVAAEFLAAQPWIVLGADDAHGRMWATVLYGRPGFITIADAVDASPSPPGRSPGDPLDGALNGPVGGLAIEPGTRRRMRLNGEACHDRRRRHDRARAGLLELPEVHRDAARRGGRADAPVAPRAHARSTRAAVELLAARGHRVRRHPRPGRRCDASHRGGNPGFLRVVDAHTIVWPDYSGNSMFNTLGNIAVDPATGLTVVDPGTGTTLYLSGRAEVLWEDGGFPSAHALVRLTVDAVVRLDARRTAALGARTPGAQPAASC